MTLVVKHTKHSVILDDPVSAAAGEVLPSDWNANHALTGIANVSQGGTGADLSATGGVHQFLKQSSVGAAITVGQPAASDISGLAPSATIDTTNADNITGGSQSGTGSMLRGRNTGGAIFFASAYGAVADGLTDNTAFIQAAINAAQASGGIVQLPAGQCLINSGLTITSPIVFRGVGMGAGAGQVSNTSCTQLLANFANGDVILATTDLGVVFRDFQINSNVGARSSGAGIHIKAANPLTTANANSIVENVATSNQVVGIQCTVCAYPRIFNNYHQAFVSHGILIDYVASAVESGGGFISENYIFGTNTTCAGITSHAGYFKIHDNTIINCGTGIQAVIDQRAAGNPVFVLNTIENFANTGILVKNSGGIAAAMVQIVDNEFSASNATAQSSIQFIGNSGGAGSWIDGIQISGNIFRNSLTNGGGVWTIILGTGTNVQITGNESDHLAGDTSNFILFGAEATAPVLVRDNTETGTTTGARYASVTAQVTIIDNIGLPFASMPALAANGSQIFVTNGAPNSNPLTGASTGAMAIRQNGAWIGLGAVTYGAGVATLLTGTASGTGGPAGTVSPTFTGSPILAAPSATTLITGSSTTLPASDVGVFTANATTLPAIAGGVLLHLGGIDSGSVTPMAVESFAAPATGIFRRADTSNASKSALPLNAIVMNFVSQGYGATTYGGTRAYVRSFAAEAWSDTAQGMGVDIGTTPATTAANALAARFQPSGGVSIGTTTDPGIGGILANTSIKSQSATAGVGYATGAGGTVTQGTNRTTGVTINSACGAITLFSQVNTAISQATAQSFTVTNSAVAATDVPHVVQKSGTDKYEIFVTNVAAGSFQITNYAVAGTTNEAPVFNFAIIKAVTA